ncbi:MAG TPA: N-acetylmuramoyl-L-alanine amidase, partial [Solirubrobacteraceae bacterium]|nr:N-acetylmuramoyl-L-alanine amidase [Solirubrobacteraceae bacterium]
VRMAFVHHTENPNGYLPGEVPAMLRAIFAFHRYVRGWNDIGYNFVIDLYGRIFEARAGGIDEAVVGAQAGGYNTESTGVAVLGEFMSVPVSPAAARALERLLAWKLSLHGVPALGQVTVRVNPAGASYTPFRPGQRVSLPRVAGHRDGDSTDCPGNVLYAQLPELRPRIHRLAGRPARLTLTLAGQAPAAPGQPAGAVQITLAGTFTFLDGTPITGASVLVQARSVAQRGEVVDEQTLARAVSDAGGSWSATIVSAPSGGVSWLRALCPGGGEAGSGGAGATASEALSLAGAVTGAPAAPPTAAEPVPPAS